MPLKIDTLAIVSIFMQLSLVFLVSLNLQSHYNYMFQEFNSFFPFIVHCSAKQWGSNHIEWFHKVKNVTHCHTVSSYEQKILRISNKD